MSSNNGVIRIGKKGVKKFAFGEEGPIFEVDVVVAFQQWIGIDDGFRPEMPDADGNRPILGDQMEGYHRAAVGFAQHLSGSGSILVGEGERTEITTAEALDFIARLREQYDELASFFRPRSREELASPDTSAVGSELRFSVEN